MKVSIDGQPKEIADFVLALQNQQKPLEAMVNNIKIPNGKAEQVILDLIGKPVEISKIEDINAFIETARLNEQ